MIMKIKICGIKTLDDALAAIDAGADMLGFNFYPPSPRYIEPQRCAHLVAALHELSAGITTVGVFVNTPPADVRAILVTCGLDQAQLSGDEPPEALAALSGRAFKALRPRKASAARLAAARYARCTAPALLVDAATAADQFGGTGHAADWRIAAALAAKLPLLLAGGLRPDNVAAAIAAVRPWGVDVASGVESAPGVKEAAKMRAFVRAARLSI
jgi:phosphoribosylanthranilate isomerase